MKKTILNLCLLLTLLVGASQMAQANANSNNPVVDNSLFYRTSWTTGPLSTRYLDFAHTTHTDEVVLEPGRYKWTLVTQRRNGKEGRVNFDIKQLYKNAQNEIILNKPRTTSGRTTTGTFTLSDYKSRTSGTAGYSKIKVHIGRADIDTNVNYKITITKVSGGNGSNSGCSYTFLGSGHGNVWGMTTGKKAFKKKACKDVVNVKVYKVGGSARTTVSVYASSQKNGVGTLKGTYEFRNSRLTSSHNFRLNNVNGKFIRIEMQNRSVTNAFKWKATAKQ